MAHPEQARSQACRRGLPLLGLDEHERLGVEVCARVRDIGMIGLPDYGILNADVLSAVDRAPLNRHPALGAEMLLSVPTMAAAAEIVRAHPRAMGRCGLPGWPARRSDSTPSRVVVVRDAIAAVASDGPHRSCPAACPDGSRPSRPDQQRRRRDRGPRP